MMLNISMRTDIPAFYPEWLANRFKEGFILTRNPYNPQMVTKYDLSPKVVDIIEFCTKNPGPILPYLHLFKDYHQYWHVTITPYGKDIEPNLPDKNQVIKSFQALSREVGKANVVWRYDPIFIYGKYTLAYHLHIFEEMAKRLSPYTNVVIVSFVDLYEKVKRNFPDLNEVTLEQKHQLMEGICTIAKKYQLIVRPCGEGKEWQMYGADVQGCSTIKILEDVFKEEIHAPQDSHHRDKVCSCQLGRDIGHYDSCLHLCKYCYANNSAQAVHMNHQLHDPRSPFLIGTYQEGDIIKEAKQSTWLNPQLSFDLF